MEINDEKTIEDFEKEILNRIDSKSTSNNHLSTPKISIMSLIFNKFNLMLIIFLILFFVSGTIIEDISQLSINIVKFINYNFFSDYNISIQVLSLIAEVIFYFIIIEIISFIGLNIMFYNWPKIRKILLTEFIIVILIISLILVYTLASNNLNSGPNETISNIKTNINSTLMKSIKNGLCYLSYSCLTKKFTENKATVSNKAEYSIKLVNLYPPYSQFEPSDLKYGLEFNYNILSGGDFYIDKIECYYNSFRNKPFSTTEIKQNIDASLEPIPINFVCENFNKINLTEKKNKLHILIKAYIKVKTIFKQEVPIINYKLFLEENKIYNNPSYYNLKPKLDAYTYKDKTFYRSNKAIQMDDNLFINSLPILNNDNKERKILFPIRILKDELNDFGELKSAKIIDFKLPEVLKFVDEDQKSIIGLKLDANKDEINKLLHLKEVEIEPYKQIEKTESIKIIIESNFEKTDSFNIIVMNPNYNKSTNIDGFNYNENNNSGNLNDSNNSIKINSSINN